MASSSSRTFSTDPALWIFTSLTAGSAHIVTATSRLETILRANKVPFKAVDIATDDKARMLWGRRAGKDASGRMRKLPGLVQEGVVLGDLVEIEDWNEYGELKQNVKIYYDDYTIPTISEKPKQPPPKPKPAPTPAAAAPPAPPLPPASAPKPKQEAKPAAAAAPQNPPGPSIADEAAKKAKEMRLKSLREKVYGKEGAKAKAEEDAKGGVKDADAKVDKADAEKPKDAENKDEEVVTEPKSTEDTEAKDKDKPDSEEETAEPDKAEADDKHTPPALKPTPSVSSESKEGLQSPTSAAWKPVITDSAQPLQSPTSSGWHASLPERKASFRGSVVESPSEEEIEAIEKEEEIVEEPDEEEKEGKEQDEEEKRRSVSQS